MPDSDDLSASMPVKEGDLAVPGGVLHYRLAGADAARPVVVFENGWSGSHPYAAWIEQALARRLRVLCYDRAGVGYSAAHEPPTAAGMTLQLRTLLAALGIREPVVLAGHSYGGLIGALHAAQAPGMVSALVQIDPTPEFEDKLIDPSLKIVPLMGRVLQLFTWLGMDGLVLAEFARHLPAEAYRRMLPGTRRQVESLNGAIAEIRLLDEIRRIVTASAAAAQVPRLIISAMHLPRASSGLKKLLGGDEKERRFRDAAQAVHRRQASLNDASRWMELPYSHVGLIARRESAKRIATAIFGFIHAGNTA